MPVCVGDDIKFAINFYNLHGMIDLHTIEWKTPFIEETPSIPRELESNFLDGIDRNRICEVEELNADWVLYKYFDKKNKIEYDNFNPQLVLKETKCSGIDVISMRSRYDVSAIGTFLVSQ